MLAVHLKAHRRSADDRRRAVRRGIGRGGAAFGNELKAVRAVRMQTSSLSRARAFQSVSIQLSLPQLGAGRDATGLAGGQRQALVDPRAFQA